jgi:hypothetical protein
MKIKRKYQNEVFFYKTTEDLIKNLVYINEGHSRVVLTIIARMLDAMPLTDQQKLDIIDPCGVWEIVEEPK